MNSKLICIILLALIVILSCRDEGTENAKLTSEDIILKSYQASGMDKLKNSDLSFRFRDINYKAERLGGKYSLQREFQDSIGRIRDVLDNEKFQRFINDQAIEIPDSMANRYQESVNSVHYFSVLPFGLKDGAVNSKIMDTVSIKNENYFKLQITFNKEGGGQDFEDVFIYWVNTESYYIDYLAYSFTVNGGGLRFREAFNPRTIDGVRFVDYNNYKPKSNDTDLYDLDEAFKNQHLELLSKIELEDVAIN